MPDKQRTLLNQWVQSLSRIPELDVIWLDGSLADAKRANPGSDVDIRFGIADSAFDQLWKANRKLLLEGMGEYLPIHPGNFRFLAATGVLVEAIAFKTSELEGKEFFEWEFLFCRLPEYPKFKKLPKRSAAETWPTKETLNADKFRYWNNNFLHELSRVPSTFHSGEVLSAWATLDWVREELLKILYLRAGVEYPNRSKHFSDVLPVEYLSDLGSTYKHLGKSALEQSTIAAAIVDIFEVLGRHLQAMSDQAGGGFESQWYYRLLDQVKNELHPFMQR